MKYFLGRGLGPQLLWILSALFFKGLMILSQGNDNGLGELYLMFLILIPILFFFITKRTKSYVFEGEVGVLALVTSVFLSFDLHPFFENDFYRYFWEGTVLRSGYNPYLLSPLDLQGIVAFDSFFGIGYPELTSVYPPLILILFSFLGLGGFSVGVLLLGLLSAYILKKILGDLLNQKEAHLSEGILFLVFFYLFRECIVHHHFELVAFYPFWLGLKRAKGEKLQKLLGFFFSFQFKLVGLLGWFNFDKKSEKVLFGILLIFGLLLFSFLGFFESLGLKAFHERWLFAPGFINLGMKAGWSFQDAKAMSLGLFILLAGILGLITFLRGEKKWGFCIVLISFFYFSPVYNAWYALWPGLTLLHYQRKEGAWYLFLSPLCYLYYTSLKEWVFLGNVVLHLPFYFLLLSLSKSLVKALESPL